MAAHMSLRPNRDLLHPNFEGYKLSLDPLPTYQQKLSSDVARENLDETQYSVQHVKMFGLHNHLHCDPWNEDTLYYVKSDREIEQLKFGLNEFLEPKVVYKVPFEGPQPGAYNVSLQFASPQLVVLGDGLGTLQLLMTGDRNTVEPDQWKVVFTYALDSPLKPFVVVHAMFSPQQQVDCLLISVDDKKNVTNLEESISPFATVVTWISLGVDDGDKWSLVRVRKLVGLGAIEYAAVNPRSHAVLIASNYHYKFMSDSVNPVKEKPDISEEKKDEDKPLYAWTQSLDKITVVLKLAEGMTKADVSVKFGVSNLEVSLRDGSLSLEGPLFASIDAESSTWSISGDKLEIFLFKQEHGLMWQELLVGNTRGEELINPALMEEIHRRLAHLTSSEVVQPSDKPAFNPDQLEECDAFPSDFFTLAQLDGESHECTHQINLSGHQWLFTVALTSGALPAFCVRHDVDGVVWQPGDDCDMNHEITFHAFGYVQASKQDRKFCSCAPDGSYAVICDLRRHIYVYRQPTPLTSNLRNRRTGSQVSAVARQQVVSIDTTSEVLGLQVLRKNLFVLTKDHVYAIRVHTE